MRFSDREGLQTDINQAAFGRLLRRFGVRQASPSQESSVKFFPTIFPVSDVDKALLVPIARVVTKDLSAAAGTFISFFEVPASEIWVLRGWYRDSLNTAERLWLRTKTDNTANITTAPLGASQTAVEQVRGTKMWLSPGWALGVQTTGNALDTAVALWVFGEAYPV